MKIRQIEYKTGFLNSTLWKIRCSLDPKAQAVNKVQRQLRPEPYFPEFFKSRTQDCWTVWYTTNPGLLDGTVHHQSRTAGRYGTPPIQDCWTVRYTTNPGLLDGGTVHH